MAGYWKLSQGRRHATDISNASRTMLFNLQQGDWDDDLLDLFEIPRAILPEVCAAIIMPTPSCQGVIPITGIATRSAGLVWPGLQQPGMAKNTYGAALFHAHEYRKRMPYSQNGLITTANKSTKLRAEKLCLRGSVFMGGAIVQWLR